jgi:RNA polymerase sigma-70 factor (ECF subfamily)
MDHSTQLEQLAARRDKVVARLRARVGSEADAEDIFQLALMRAAERLDSLREEDRLNAWFDAIVRRLTVDFFTSGVKQREVATDAPPEPTPELEPADNLCGCGIRLLESIRPEYAELVRRVDLGDDTVQEAADAIGISANNASVRLHRARRALREELNTCCGTTSLSEHFSCQCG